MNMAIDCSQGLLPRRAAGARHVIWQAALLMGLLALTACASKPTWPADPRDAYEVDYRARHEQMLETVMERPLILEMQRQERERRAQRDTTNAWEAVAARQRAYDDSQKVKAQASDAYFQRLLERQQKHESQRTQQRNDRWARFIEANPITPGADGSAPLP